MPIIRAGSKLIYFAHVPKCAGSAVEDYMRERFGPIGFRDTRYLSRPVEARWSLTSPQHVDVATLRQMFPRRFFDASFAVVRHPVSRIVSAWHFHLEVEKTIPEGVTFSDWLAGLGAEHAAAPFAHDNHTRPMTEMVPEEAEIFRLEDGLAGVVDWLDAVTGDRNGPREIGHSNERGAHGASGASRVTPSPADLETIAVLYAEDFERFGYDGAAARPKRARTAGRAAGRAAPFQPKQALRRLGKRLLS